MPVHPGADLIDGVPVREIFDVVRGLLPQAILKQAIEPNNVAGALQLLRVAANKRCESIVVAINNGGKSTGKNRNDRSRPPGSKSELVC